MMQACFLRTRFWVRDLLAHSETRGLARVSTAQALLAMVLVFGLVLRLLLILHVAPYPERYIQSDAAEYNQIARNLIAGHGFSRESHAPYPPDNLRMPVYPLTLAFLYTLFGYQPLVVQIFQAILDTLTLLLVYLIGQRIAGQKVGLFAAGLLALSPHTITYSALLWSELEFTFLLTLSILVTLIMFARLGLKWILLSAVLLGVTTLTHARSVLLPLLFAVLLLVLLRRRHFSLRRGLAYTAAYLLTFLLVIAPWVIRNYAVFGIVNLTAISGINMLRYGAGPTEAARSGESQSSLVDDYDVEIKNVIGQSANEAQYAEKATQLAWQKILADPLGYAVISVEGMTRIFMPGTSSVNTLLTGQKQLERAKLRQLLDFRRAGWNPLSELLAIFSPASLLYIGFDTIYLGIVYMLILLALARAHAQRAPIMFLLLVALYLAVITGSAGAPRFRVAMMPVLCVVAASNLASSRRTISAETKNPAANAVQQRV